MKPGGGDLLLTVHTGVLLCRPCSLDTLRFWGHTGLHGRYTDRGCSWGSPTGLDDSLSTAAPWLPAGTCTGLILGHTGGSPSPLSCSHRLEGRRHLKAHSVLHTPCDSFWNKEKYSVIEVIFGEGNLFMVLYSGVGLIVQDHSAAPLINTSFPVDVI